MVLTPSTMLPLGTPAPDFELFDTVGGNSVQLASFTGKKVLVVMFLSNHCPYVQHLSKGIAKVAHDYASKDVALVAICANDPSAYPDDAPEKMTREAREKGYRFPYLFDGSQEIAKAYRAACTPDFYVFDADRKLVYRGQFDDSRPDNGRPVTGADLRAAINAVLADKPLPADQKPSMGCNIKWRPKNEPDYFKAQKK